MNPTAAEGEDVVTAGLAGRFAVTLGHPLRAFAPGEPAPLGLHWCLAPEHGANADLEADGIAADGIIPALDLPHRLWAGSVVRLRGGFRVGETVRRRSAVIGTTRKVGRSGPLAFVRIGHRFLVGAETRLEEEQTIVYRAASSEATDGSDAAPRDPRPAARDRVVRRVPTDPAMLFRFSALTFNAHRIHYDLGHARTEDLPERLVHGTLTAALLLDALAPALPPAAAVTFRATRPVACGAVLDLVLDGAGGPTDARASVDGETAMTATVAAAFPPSP